MTAIEGSPGAEQDRVLRGTALAWLALLALMLTSLASAWLPIGRWHLAVGVLIAALKSAIVLGRFMRLRHAGALVRSVAVAGGFTLALLFALTGLEDATRLVAPAPVQALPSKRRPGKAMRSTSARWCTG